MGFRVLLRSNNSLRLMSALGQKRTFREVETMSALPPKADIGTQPRDVRFVPLAAIGDFVEQPRRRLNVLSRRSEEDVLCNALCVALGDRRISPAASRY